MNEHPFFSILPEERRILERYELWAFGRAFDDGTRRLMMDAPSVAQKPGIMTGRFPGCERHNDYIEKWAAFRAAFKASCPDEYSAAEDAGLMNVIGGAIERLKHRNEQIAERSFWEDYRRKTSSKSFGAGASVFLVIVAILAIPLHVIGLIVTSIVGAVTQVLGFLRGR